MKTSLLLILFFSCIAITAVAQSPTLTSANSTFTVGEEFFSQTVKAASVPELNGGENQTWDYSNIIDSGNIIGVGAVTPQSTPFADSFPASNLVVKTLNDSAFLYYSAQTSNLSQLGVSAIDGTTIRYIPSKIYLSYPFSYTSFVSDSVAQVSASLGVLFSGRDSLTGDGYGTLKTPGHVYNNVLRIKYVENTSYTVENSGISTTIKLRGVDYVYFTPGTHAPLFSNGTVQSRTTITFLGIPLSDTTVYVKSASYLNTVILPLSFTSFNASLNNNAVNLKWQTAQETNTSHFNVQRSLTGADFTNIAELKASGNSIVSNYSYTDEDYVKPGVPPTVFYRIKETDKDGKEFYSETRLVHGNSGTISLYPNPVTNAIHFNVKDSTVADAILIYDAKGHLVKQVSNYPLSQPLNVSNFSKGNYFIQMKIAGKTTTTTIIKD